MSCCCQSCKAQSSSCLGRCDLPKHRCLEKEEVKPGPVPKHMGWMYCAKESPRFQKKCGWRPGHISCTVLRRIEAHNGSRETCGICPSRCSTKPSISRTCSRTCSRVCSRPCLKPCFGVPCPNGPPCQQGQPLIRIIRHAGQYKICTKPSNLINAPSSPYPLKYVLNQGADDDSSSKTKYSIEAKFNDYQYDYTSSQSSFVIDFTPPASPCAKPCPKKSILCMYSNCESSWPPGGEENVTEPPPVPKQQLNTPLNETKKMNTSKDEVMADGKATADGKGISAKLGYKDPEKGESKKST